MNTPEFVALGYCSNDHLCRIPEIPGDGKIEMTEYRIQGGGPAGDAAVGAARLGLSAAFVTSVGDDMDGRLILADFAAEKVDTSAIRVRRGGRSRSPAAGSRPDGRRSVAWTKNNLELLKSDEIPLEMIRRAKILHLDGHHPDAAVSAARAAKAAGVLVNLDAGTFTPRIGELLELADILDRLRILCAQMERRKRTGKSARRTENARGEGDRRDGRQRGSMLIARTNGPPASRPPRFAGGRFDRGGGCIPLRLRGPVSRNRRPARMHAFRVGVRRAEMRKARCAGRTPDPQRG